MKNKVKKIVFSGGEGRFASVFKKFVNLKNYYFPTKSKLNKQGKYTPGTHIKIISPEEGMKDKIDYAFLGAWNFKKEIFKKEKNFLRRGGQFITHVPKVMVIKK